MPPDDLWSFHHDETPGPCVEIDTRLDRETVYAEVVEHLAEHTEPMLEDLPLGERPEELLGLRPRTR